MKVQENHSSIEPGIFSVLRLFVVLQLAQTGWNLMQSGHTNYVLLEKNFPQLVKWLVERRISPRFYLAWLGLLLLFLLFLTLPQFQRWLKRFYFPLALAFQIIILVAQNDWVTFVRLSENPDIGIGARDWQMFVFLSVPVLLASWQYSFRVVLLLVIFSGALDFFVLYVPGAAFIPRPAIFYASVTVRTILYGLIGYTVTRLMREQRQLRLSMQTANQKLAHYVSTLDALATARERNRLARELHDTLAHTLSGLVIQLEAIDILWEQEPKTARAELQASTTQAREGLNEARRAINSLRSAPLEEMGLLLSLHQVARDASRRGGFQAEIDLPDAIPPLPFEVENDLYRMAGEALENVVRHARAKHAELSLTLSEGALLLKIIDDGRGFDMGAIDIGAHFGLLGLRERAKWQGADFKIESLPGRGTKISLRMELPHDTNFALR